MSRRSGRAPKPTPFSVRLSERTRAKLAVQARREGIKVHALVVRIVEEATRTASHPLVRFADRGDGRRAVVDGWELWEVIVAFLFAQEDLAATAVELGIAPEAVEAAVAYYGEFAAEIDELLSARLAHEDTVRRGECDDFDHGIAVLKKAPGRRRA